MKTDRLRLVSWGVWLGFTVYGAMVYPLLYGVAANAVPGFPLALNQGSTMLLAGYAFVFLVAHYLGIVGRAEKNDIKMQAVLLIVSLPLSAIYWLDPGRGFLWFFVLLVGLALEFQRPNWIWEIRSRKRHQSV